VTATLFDQLTKYDNQPAPAADVAPAFTCVIKQTRAGRDLMLCSVEPFPAEAINRAEREGLPLFGPGELARLANLDQQSVDAILLSKQIFTGATVERCLREVTA